MTMKPETPSERTANGTTRAPSEANVGTGTNGTTQPDMCHRCHERPRSGKHRWCTVCQRDAKKARRRAEREAENLANVARAADGNDPNDPLNGDDTGSEADVYARSAERIPRRDVTLIYRVVLHDEAPLLYQQLVKGCRRSPRFALDVLERIADRLHGKPKQPIEATARRPVYFTQAMPAPDAQAEAVAGAVLDAALSAPEPVERVDLAAALPELDARPLVVLPPPR